MGILSEWLYPGALRQQSHHERRGPILVQSIKCTAVLTTADPIEKVLAFYAAKFDKPQRLENGEPNVTSTDARSVTTLEDSADRPVTMHIMVVNKADTITTLVISRAEGEGLTHIAWTHYLVIRRK